MLSLDPIGTFFSASRRLPVYLQQQSNTHSDQGMLDECLRTKNLFMAVHCYMLTVKIFTSLLELLLSQIRRAQVGQLTPLEGYQFESSPSSCSRDRSSVDTIPLFNPNLHIGGLFSYLNPSCTPYPRLASPCGSVYSCCERKRALLGSPRPASRILSMVWSEEVDNEEAKSAGAAGPRSRTLAVLRRCYGGVMERSLPWPPKQIDLVLLEIMLRSMALFYAHLS